MALSFQPFEVIFRGLGEHSDPKTQLPGELVECENAVFTKRNRIAKRRGYQLISSATDTEGDVIDPRNVYVNAATLHGELVVFGLDTLYALAFRGSTNPSGDGDLVARGPTFRGNVAVMNVSTAPLSDE